MNMDQEFRNIELFLEESLARNNIKLNLFFCFNVNGKLCFRAVTNDEIDITKISKVLAEVREKNIDFGISKEDDFFRFLHIGNNNIVFTDKCTILYDDNSFISRYKDEFGINLGITK